MWSLGVTRIDAYCGCGYQASIDVSYLPDDQEVLSGCDCAAQNAATSQQKRAQTGPNNG
jgi:hypothetical protein